MTNTQSTYFFENDIYRIEAFLNEKCKDQLIANEILGFLRNSVVEVMETKRKDDEYISVLLTNMDPKLNVPVESGYYLFVFLVIDEGVAVDIGAAGVLTSQDDIIRELKPMDMGEDGSVRYTQPYLLH